MASVRYRPKGLVEAKDVIRFRDGARGGVITPSRVLAAGDGFSEEAMKVFQRSKHRDYLSEAHWPNDWPKAQDPAKTVQRNLSTRMRQRGHEISVVAAPSR